VAVASAKQNWHEVQPGNTPCRKLCAKFRFQASVGRRLIQEFQDSPWQLVKQAENGRLHRGARPSIRFQPR